MKSDDVMDVTSSTGDVEKVENSEGMNEKPSDNGEKGEGSEKKEVEEGADEKERDGSKRSTKSRDRERSTKSRDRDRSTKSRDKDKQKVNTLEIQLILIAVTIELFDLEFVEKVKPR